MTAHPGLRRFLRPPTGPPATPEGAAAPAGPPATPEGAAANGPSAGGRAAGPAPVPGDTAPSAQPDERCEMCRAGIGPGHGHVADLERSTLSCACRACYLLFTGTGAGGGRYRAVPDRYLTDPARPLTTVEWERLQIPVGLAFFLNSSPLGRVCAFYPSPAGVTECLLDLDTWAELTRDHPIFASAEPDVEAVLASRTDAGLECFLVPVDACYELAGRMRMLWRGFDGGAEARQAIARFLDGVRSRAASLTPET